jgi:ABC-type sugar transport system ATPase subunit
MNKEMKKLLKAEKLTKKYLGITALDGVDFELDRGEVHALIGENGAGKSTLIKLLMGITAPDEGIIYINEKKADIKNPHNASEFGISAVFQELSLVPYLSVAENIFLNAEGKGSRYFLNRKELYKKTGELFEKYDVDVLNSREIVSNVSPANRQLVEIMKAVSKEPKILIFDEPTSSLSDNEAKILFMIVRTLREKGIGIIYITHRMNELEQLADRITILRDGKYVCTEQMKALALNDIVKYMVGREFDLYKSRATGKHSTEKVLEVKNICKKGWFKNISFDLYKGEVLGIAGLVGSGRSELMRILFGIDKADSGEIWINGRKVVINSVGDALKHKLALVPESRHIQGLVLIHSIADNITLPIIEFFQKYLFLDHNKKSKFAEEAVKRYSIKTDNTNKIVGQLSGGNQQKVVLAKWLSTNPEILIIDEPTAGIDVYSKFEIHEMIRKLTERGLSVIMISSEMPELLTNSDRIMVLDEYEIIGTLETADQETIMHLILNHKNVAKTKRMG